MGDSRESKQNPLYNSSAALDKRELSDSEN